MYTNSGDTTTSASFYVFLILTIFIIGRPQDIFLFLQPLRLGLVLGIINVILVFTQNINPISIILRDSIGKKYLYFYGIMVLGIPFAIYRKVAFDYVIFQYSLNVLYFGLFLLHINSYKRMRTQALTIVCSICFYGLVSLHFGIGGGGRFSFGSMYDPNDLAYLLVSFVSFTAFFFTGKGTVATKLLAVFTAGISMVVIVKTGSRGGLIALVVLLLLFLFTKLNPTKRPIKLVFLIGIMVFVVVNKDMIFTERNKSILNPSQDYNVTSDTGRIEIWEKGLEFTFKKPLTGVGAWCFPEAIGTDRKERGVAQRWQAVHNSYIQISSELGLIAFIIFMLMMKDTVQILRKVRKGDGDQMIISDEQKLAGIVQIGFISHCTAAFFLTQGYSMLFTLFFAFAAAMNKTFNHE